MRKIIIKYKVETGDITGYGIYEEGARPDCLPGESSMEIERPIDTERFFVRGGVLTERLKKPGIEYDWDGYGWVKNPAISSILAKNKRAQLLSESDWTQLPDVPLETRQAWMTYRQALRDITSQPGYPTDIAWPEPPQ